MLPGDNYNEQCKTYLKEKYGDVDKKLRTREKYGFCEKKFLSFFLLLLFFPFACLCLFLSFVSGALSFLQPHPSPDCGAQYCSSATKEHPNPYLLLNLQSSLLSYTTFNKSKRRISQLLFSSL